MGCSERQNARSRTSKLRALLDLRVAYAGFGFSKSFVRAVTMARDISSCSLRSSSPMTFGSTSARKQGGRLARGNILKHLIHFGSQGPTLIIAWCRPTIFALIQDFPSVSRGYLNVESLLHPQNRDTQAMIWNVSLTYVATVEFASDVKSSASDQNLACNSGVNPCGSFHCPNYLKTHAGIWVAQS